MGTIIFLIAFPVIIALILLVTKGDKTRDSLVKFASVIMTAASVALAVQYFIFDGSFYRLHGTMISDYCMMAIELVIAVFIIYIGIKHRKYLLSVLALVQMVGLALFELIEGNGIDVEHEIYMDGLSVVMVLICGIIGSIICIYSVSYFKNSKHDSLKRRDKMKWYGCFFISIAAVNGMVLSNNLNWMYFFWELMILATFFMMKSRGTVQAEHTAFRALTFNMLAGLGFVTGIVILGVVFGTVELNVMILVGTLYGDLIAIPAAFISFAGLIMAAQLPFSRWLTGAEAVSPPAMAFIQTVSVTSMGIFLILKLSPVLGMDNFAGLMVIVVGAVTFLTSSIAAINESSYNKVINFSTAAVSGLAVACAGLGSGEALWTAVMVMIFHAVSKALMFMCIGKASACEEDYDGDETEDGQDTILPDYEDTDIGRLFENKSGAAYFMVFAMAALLISVCGMFVSRAASVAAVADSGNIVLTAALGFGAVIMIAYWIKWIGALAMNAAASNVSEKGESGFALHKLLTAFIIILCIAFPVISEFMIVPYLDTAFGGFASMTGLVDNIIIMVVMTVALLLLAGNIRGKSNRVIKSEEDYMETEKVGSAYIDNRLHYFEERKVSLTGGILAAVMMIVGLGYMIGSLVSLLGGVA